MVLEKDAFKIACLLRLSPIHFGLVTAICAVTEISFPIYLLATCISMNVEMPLYVFAGTTLRSLADVSTMRLDTSQLVVIGVQCAVIGIAFIALTLVRVQH
jgi:uncharacterized membrane protein YdjX (TVP38/TMEM64 family)